MRRSLSVDFARVNLLTSTWRNIAMYGFFKLTDQLNGLFCKNDRLCEKKLRGL